MMNFQGSSLHLLDEYKLNRLVMINSAEAHYVDIAIDETAVLIGANNKGKTSTFNTLKLFMLPEVNFKNSYNKFGFVSGQGERYTDNQSYNFYFPSSESFIVLEATNPKGSFCILLYRGREEYSYARIAVPKAYDEIKYLFWDSHLDKNDGKGGHPDDLSLK